MPYEQRVSGFILKKQTLKETAELVTFFTLEKGKTRAKAEGIKKPASRLLGGIQLASEITFGLVGSRLPKIINPSVKQSFSAIWSSDDKLRIFAWYLETLDKALGDESPDEKLYRFSLKVFHALSVCRSQTNDLQVFVCYTALRLAEVLGFKLNLPTSPVPRPLFSFPQGGVVETGSGAEGWLLTESQYLALNNLHRSQVINLPELPESDTKFLKEILINYLSYHLERRLNSQRFLP